MTSYPQQFLYVSDDCGEPTELVNGARLARNLENAGQCGVFGNVTANMGCEALTYRPGAPDSLLEAVLWLDASDDAGNDQTISNRGTGGAPLDAYKGASFAVGTDEPLLLNGSENYLYTPGVAGNNASVPDTAALRIVGDIEVIVRVSLDDWTPSASQTLVSKYLAGTAGYELFVDTSGNLNLVCRVGAANVTGTSTVPTGIPDGTARWIRVTRASASGTVTFYTAHDQQDIPTVWTQLGGTASTTAGAIVSGSQTFLVGERTGSAQPAAAKFFYVAVRNAIDASPPVNVGYIDFTANTAQSSFVAQAGTVTINRSTSGRKTVCYTGRPLWLFGTDDFIEVADHSLLDFDVLDSFSVMVLQRHHSATTPAAETILRKGTTARWAMTNNNGAATSSFVLSDGAATPTRTMGSRVASRLHALVGVRDVATDSLIGYQDGVAAGSTTDTTTAASSNAQTLRIGATGAGAEFVGSEIMAVVVWRRALTATEVAEVSAWYTSQQTLAGSLWNPVDFSSTGAPWYNSSVSASTEAYGFLIEEWTGLDGAHNRRSSYASGMRQGGAYYGAQTHDPRVMKLNVLLHGSSEAGLNYLFNWLTDRLLSCCNANCSTRQLWFRETCPTSLSNLADGYIRVDRIALLEGPTWEAPPVSNAGCYLRRVSFTFGVGDPCLYGVEDPLYGPVTMSTAGVASTDTLALSSFNKWAGTALRAQAGVPTPALGETAPVVTIAIPPGGGGGLQYGVPMLRIAGYDDPHSTDDPNQAYLIGELIIEAPRSAGYTIVADLANRTVTYSDPYGFGSTQVGSSFIGAAVRPGVKRWWSTSGCRNVFVVVEPVYDSLQTLRTDVGSYAEAVTSWTVQIDAVNRRGCC